MANRFDLVNLSNILQTSANGTVANVNFDSNTLFIDGVNNRVGIGTSSPINQLAVVGGAMQFSPGTSAQEGVRIQRAAGVCTFSGINNDNNTFNGLAFFTGASEAMRIDTSGRVTIPGQPAFNATIPFTTNAALWPDNNANFVNYVSTHLNRGSHFNATNGRFTAPVAGAYLFCASFAASSGSATDLNDYQISINDTPSENYSPPTVLTYPTSTIWQAASMSVILNLAANDFVTVRRTCCNNNKPGAFRMNFMGCLIG